MVLPRNVEDARWRGHDFSDVRGAANLSYYDSEMKDGEIGSRQNITTIDVLCEGEIAGFPSAIDAGHAQGTNDYRRTACKDIYLNNVQILRQSASNTAPDDGDFNFGTNATRPAFIPKFGTSDQTKIRGIAETERERSVAVKVTADQAQTVSITDTNTDGVRVTLGFPRLQKIEDDGSISGTTVEYNIKVLNQAGTLIREVVHQASQSDTVKQIRGGRVSGKSTSPYFKDHIIDFGTNPDGTPVVSSSDFPVTVTVSRITADSTDVRLIDEFEFTSLTELEFDVSTFPNTALAAIRFDAEIFRSIPQRMYRIRGRLVKIPHNSTVRSDGSLSFSGSFNGTLKTAKEWCNDPAWVLYDIITESRAGFGDFVSEDQVDKYSFYNASVYNSELINNGQGGTSPRFSCNIVIQSSHQAYTLLNKIASVMRATLFIEDGQISLSQDRPTTSSYFFSYANVTEDGFVYTGVSQATKDTVVNVKYFQNETRSYEYETVEDTSVNQSKYGVVIKNIEAIGCSDQAQARRMGLWHLYTQNNETETVAFTTTADAGSLVRPGDVITIQDPVRSGVRRSGRISAATTTQITVDNTKDLPTAPITGDQLSVILTDGTLETKTISSISGSVITVASAYTSAPQVNSVWLFVRATTETEDFKVISVKEDNNLFTIAAMFHNSSKYAFIEDGAEITRPVITNLIDLKDAPSNLSCEERIIVLGDRAVSKLILSWSPVSGVSQYSVKHKYNNSSFQTTIVQGSTFELFETQVGVYEFEVYSYNAFFEPSVLPNSLTFTAVGKTALPKDPKNLTVEPISEQFIRLRFDASTDVDVLHSGAVQVRHTPNTGATATFANSTDIIPQISGGSTEALVPALSGTYSIKFIDDGGRKSQNAAKIIVTQPDPQPHQVILTQREDTTTPPFQGEKTRTVYDSNLDGLVLDGSMFFDNVTSIDVMSNFDFLTGDIFGLGFYDFQNIVDLSGIFNLTLKRRFITFANVVNDLFDSRLTFIDNILDFDGAAAENCNAKLLCSTSQGNPAISTAATYSQTQNLITLNATSHGASVGDNFRIDFTNGTAEDGFLKVASVTNANVCVLEAKRKFAQYESFGESLRFSTDGDHAGLSQGSYVSGQGAKGDTVKIVFLTGILVGQDNDYRVQHTLPLGQVQLQKVGITNPENSELPLGSGILEFVKIKDSSGNNVTTSGNCNISSVFSPFNTFANGEYNARAFKFQVEMTSTDPDETINVSELGFEASVKRRTETVNTAIASNCATSGSAKTVNFQNSFFTGTGSLGGSTTAYLPTIGITLEGAVSGDYFTIPSITGTAFTIETKDANNNFKNLSFKYTAIGFGKGG